MPEPSMDKVAALADTSALKDYEGTPVVRTKIAITNAGDGLSSAMAVAPVQYPPGSKVFVVLECEVAKHTHTPIEDTGTMELTQTFKAGVATVVDKGLVQELIEQQRDAIQKAKDEASGQLRIDTDNAPGEGGEDEDAVAFRRNHMAGNHADGLVEGCPLCDQERDAEAAEAKGKG